MRKSEKAKQKMCQELVDLAKRLPEKNEKVPAWARLMARFESDLAPVSAVNNLAKQSTKGITLAKNNTISDLKIGVGRFCNVMVGRAFEAKNVELESNLKVLRTKFTRAKQDDFAAVCKEVLTEIRKYEADWADMGITKDDVPAVEANIALFEEQTPKGKILKTDKKKATKQRAAIFESVYTKAQILDVAAGFIGVDDEHYGDITDIAGIKKRSPAATQIKVSFKSAATQAPMMHQQARVAGTEAHSKSSKKGEIVFVFDHPGFYTLEIPLPNGEVKIVKDVEVKRGRTTKLEIFI